jgi:FtsP/CotA-like multicopper oxidase with cupredoxin domain
MPISRRLFLARSAAIAATTLTSELVLAASAASETAATTPRELVVSKRTLEVNRKSSEILSIYQSDGTFGAVLDPGERFVFSVNNQLGESTIVHWHGQTPPDYQDGVPGLGVPLIGAGERRSYDYTARAGTHWMHSHQGLQHQRLLAAPLIVRTSDDVRADRHEIILFFEDFLYRDPDQVLADLIRSGGVNPDAPASQAAGVRPTILRGSPDNAAADKGDMAMPGKEVSGMEMPGTQSSAASGMPPGMKMDLNDVDYDAYLANRRTLADPDVIRVEKSGRLRLRIINGASATNFHIDLGKLNGKVVAVDGNDVKPLPKKIVGLAMAQRIDILVDLPPGEGAWPIIARREGGKERTGVVVATARARVAKLSETSASTAGPVTFELESQLSAAHPLVPRPVDAVFTLALNGSMRPYLWTINERTWPDRDVVGVKRDQRVAIDFVNRTQMAHPMHLHGHHFQVVALNGKRFSGALRDTVHVPPDSVVRVEVDTDNAGQWLLHCHNAYHQSAGMITSMAYI